MYVYKQCVGAGSYSFIIFSYRFNMCKPIASEAKDQIYLWNKISRNKKKGAELQIINLYSHLVIYYITRSSHFGHYLQSAILDSTTWTLNTQIVHHYLNAFNYNMHSWTVLLVTVNQQKKLISFYYFCKFSQN